MSNDEGRNCPKHFGPLLEQKSGRLRRRRTRDGRHGSWSITPPGRPYRADRRNSCETSADPAVGHPELVANEPPATGLQDRRTPHPACPVLHPAACRKLLDGTPLSADSRAHRAVRMAPHVIEKAGPGWSPRANLRKMGRQPRGDSPCDAFRTAEGARGRHLVC